MNETLKERVSEFKKREVATMLTAAMMKVTDAQYSGVVTETQRETLSEICNMLNDIASEIECGF